MKADIGIHFIITIFLWHVSWTANEISQNYLENQEKKCPRDSSCKHVKPESPWARWIGYSVKYNQWRFCLCDNDCKNYGDCCTDSQYFEQVKQKKTAAQYKCIEIDPVANASTTERTTVPSPTKMLTHKALTTTTKMLTNETLTTTTTTAMVTDDVFYGAMVMAKCPPTWSDHRIQYACETPRPTGKEYSMTDNPVTNQAGRIYLNRFCAVCNDDATNTVLSSTKIVCDNLTVKNPDLENSKVMDTLRYNESIKQWVVQYNKYQYECAIKTVLPTISAIRPCIPSMEPVCATCNYNAKENQKCQESKKPPAGQGLEGLLYVAGKRTGHCSPGKFLDLDNESCKPLVPVGDAFHSDQVTYVGLGVSVVCLTLHLAVFTALPKERNLSEKNLASFCVSLIGSYTAFVAGDLLPAGPGYGCYTIAVLKYYSFLTSFMWMLIMSFDCWRTVRLTSKLRITAGRQTKKFLVYSAVCWLVPAMMTLFAVIVDIMNPAAAASVIGADSRPEFGTDVRCWFGNTGALFVFFVSPLCAVMAFNCMVFIWTAYMIHSSHATVRSNNTRQVRHNYRLYFRLSVLMGLTWITAIAALFTNKVYLWALFVVLNSLQGLFVFVAFTCRQVVFTSLLGGRHRDGFVNDGFVNRSHSLKYSKIKQFPRASGSVSSENTSETPC